MNPNISVSEDRLRAVVLESEIRVTKAVSELVAPLALRVSALELQLAASAAVEKKDENTKKQHHVLWSGLAATVVSGVISFISHYFGS